jgi:toxin-antitoxin system PIN domain toxin
MAFLADVNVLVALLHARHAASARTVAWLEREAAAREVLICRMAQMGVLRVLTNPSWMKEDALPAARVWEGLDLLLTDERFARVDEPARFETEWRRLTRSLPAGRCAGTDFYFAALARAGGHRLLTLDRDFLKFEQLDVVIPA